MIKEYLVIGAAVLLLLFLLYKEWTRKNKSRLYLRLLASVLAVFSLCWMAYPVADELPSTQYNAVVLTKDFIIDSVANFLTQNKNSQLYSVEQAINTNIGNSIPITNMQAFAAKHASDTLHIFGNGFNSEMIDMLHQQPVVFHANPVLSAITNIYWKQNIISGDPLLVQGNYINNRRISIKILLQAFGKTQDSVLIDGGKQQTFQLQAQPLHTGQAVYSLIVLAGKDTLEQNALPINVQSTTPLQLLMLSASPDFDNTYLKNQLVQQGYKVSINAAVSTNKTNRQYINMPAQTVNTITSKYVEQFDVLLADQETLQKMNAAELSAIRSAIADKGLGLILKLEDENAKQSFYSRYFPLKALQNEKTTSVTLHSIEDSNHFKLTITDRFAIEHISGTQTILQDVQSNAYAAVVLYGSGKILATSFGNTYSMALAGDALVYRQLWSLLLNKVAKKNINNSWRIYPQFSFADQPVHLQTESNTTLSTSVIANNALVYFKQNALLPFAYSGTYWPGAAGWQQLPQTDSAISNWYVYKNTDWQSLVAYHRNMATQEYAASHPVNYSNKAITGSSKANMQWWLFFLFIAACTFLWVEQKLG